MSVNEQLLDVVLDKFRYGDPTDFMLNFDFDCVVALNIAAEIEATTPTELSAAKRFRLWSEHARA